MRKLILLSSLLPCLLLLAACPKKNAAEADAAVEASAPEASTATADDAAAPAAPVAKNAADIARFPSGETKIDNEAVKLGALSTAVRTGPRSGNTVATLHNNTDVTRIASKDDCFLVTFADPKDASSTLMGWVGKEAFVAPAVSDAGVRDAATTDAAAPKTLTCATGQTAVTLGSAPVCKKKCNTDGDCKDKAKGSCGVAAGVTTGGKAIHVCLNE